MNNSHPPVMQLPWPHRSLSPNARMHFREKARRIAAARDVGFCIAWEAGLQLPETGALELDLTFCPPDKRRRDVDNILASLKGYLDGIFLAANTDDSRIKRIVIDWGKTQRDGLVLCQITAHSQ